MCDFFPLEKSVWKFIHKNNDNQLLITVFKIELNFNRYVSCIIL